MSSTFSPIPTLPAPPRTVILLSTESITVPCCSLITTSLIDVGILFFCQETLGTLPPFLFLFALCEIMDVPVTPCHWIFTQRQLVTLPSWSQETWSSFYFIFTAFSSHCFFLSSVPYFQFPAVCYVTACPPTILCCSLLFIKSSATSSPFYGFSSSS